MMQEAFAAQPAGGVSTPTQPDDAALLAEVRRTLASSDYTRNANFDARVEFGVATLTGKVLCVIATLHFFRQRKKLARLVPSPVNQAGINAVVRHNRKAEGAK